MKYLSIAQKRQLGIAATAAFNRLASLDLLDLPAEVVTCTKTARMEFWRQRETASLLGVVSFSEVKNDDYLKLKSRFQQLSGELGKAYDTTLRDVRGDAATTEEGAPILRQIWWAAGQAGFKPAYVEVIARNKFGNSQISTLTLKQLEDLRNTIMNRMRAKQGKGDVDARNKKQRAQRQARSQSKPPGTSADPF